MALAKTIGFEDFVLTIGDGATPTEVFAAPCAFASRALNYTKNLNEIIVPDCSDEAKPGWIVRDPLSITWDITGEGVMDEGSIDVWDEWFLDTAARSVKVTITKTTGTVVYTGKAHLQAHSKSANFAEDMRWTSSIVGSGPLVRTPPATLLAGSFMDGAEETVAYMAQREANKARRAEATQQPAKGGKKAKEAA